MTKAAASKHDPLLNSATALPLLGINKGKNKATHPFPLSGGNVSVTCQPLMRSNERVPPPREAHTAPIQSWTQ